MTIKNNQINSNFHQIAVTDANGQVTGIETGGVVLADAANLTIGGGSAGQALTTDGAGNLSWATIDSANAAFANVAGEAYSVSGANVSGQVADAASADIALSVAGGDIIGEVANAAYATSAGSATVASSANSVTLANVSGAGNIASVNLNGNASQYLSGNGAWATVSAGGYKYTREIHVDPVNGNDTTGTGAYDKPYLTIMKAHSVISSGQAVYLHVGAYTENVTWTKTNTDIIGLSQGGQVNTSGTWIVGTTTGASVRITDVAFNGTFQQNGTGRVFFRRCQVNNAFTKTSGEYLQAIDTDFGTSLTVSSAGQVVIQGAQTNFLTVNNASAVVAVSGLISGAVFTNTAGTLLVDSSIIYSATPTTAAITSSAGTATYLYNCSTATSSGTQARVSLAGFWTVGSSRFDRANSTITGTNLGTISHTDALNIIGVSTLGAVGNVRITGGSNGQVLTTNGSGNLSWTTVSSANAAYANIAGVAYSVSGANVSGAVANATFATTAGSAQSVTLANVSGAGNIASVNLNGNGSQVLAGNGAWVSTGGNVAYADVAGVAYSVDAANVSGKVSSASAADVAYSVSGANVSGQVANAASSDVALSVAGANVTGQVSFAATANAVAAANVSGKVSSASSADVALSVAGANVTGQVSSAASADVALSVAGANVSGTVGAASIAYSVNAANVSGQVSSAASADVALSVAGANVSGQVANAASADVALSVAGANVSGTVAIADLAYSIDGANVSGTVANATFATTAGTAQSVSRGNVSGVTGIGGQLQFNTAAGNLTSNERYWIGGNGVGAINVSRDAGSGTILSGLSYYNASGAGTMFFSRARGTKASPLPVQVGDRVFSALGQVYTGTGSATVDGITGWTPTTQSAAISVDITALPTSNTGVYGGKLTFAASNATSNSVVVMNFNDDGTLVTPRLRVNAPNIPASATATGQYGEIAFDFDYVYVCVATNTWKRSALTTW